MPISTLSFITRLRTICVVKPIDFKTDISLFLSSTIIHKAPIRLNEIKPKSKASNKIRNPLLNVHDFEESFVLLVSVFDGDILSQNPLQLITNEGNIGIFLQINFKRGNGIGPLQ